MSVPLSKDASLWTASQREALTTLNRNFAVKRLMPTLGPVRIRTHTLLVGPTGVGKTAAVAEFANGLGLKVCSVACNSWIPVGAYTQPPTLSTIGDFLSVNGGSSVIYLDEIDKAVPRGGAYSTSWSLGIFGEILALLDGDARLKGASWQDSHLEICAHAFIIGSGAFQDLFVQEQADMAGRKPAVGFLPEPVVDQPHTHYSSKVNGSGLPPEIASRFSGELIRMNGPSVEEYAMGIALLNKANGRTKAMNRTELQCLAEEAYSSGEGMRWYESYALRLVSSRLSKDGIDGLKMLLRAPKLTIPLTALIKAPVESPHAKAPEATPEIKDTAEPECRNGNVTTPTPQKVESDEKPEKFNPVMPPEWEPTMKPDASNQHIRDYALAAAAGLDLVAWQAFLKYDQLTHGNNEYHGKGHRKNHNTESALAANIRAASWSLREYWNPLTKLKARYEHENTIRQLADLVKDLERNIRWFPQEYSEAGMFRMLVEAASALRNFLVEWDLTIMKCEEMGELEEPEW